MQELQNSVRLIGHLGNDVELKTFQSGRKKASLSIATNANYKNAKGERITQTHWHRLVAWGKTAEMMQKYLAKGSQVAVHGALAHRSFTNKEGMKKDITEIVVRDFMRMRTAKASV